MTRMYPRSVWMCCIGVMCASLFAPSILSVNWGARCIADDAVTEIPVPASVVDPLGNRWTVGPFVLGQVGNQPVYTDIADLWLDDTRPEFVPSQARLEANGELVFDSLRGNGYTFSRHSWISDDGATVRVADVVTYSDSNLRGIWYASHLQFAPQTIEALPAASGLVGYILEDAQGRAAVEVWGQTNAPLLLSIDPRAGNNGIIAKKQNFPLPVPNGTPAVVVHLHSTQPNIAAARAMVASLTGQKILADLPPEIREHAINFLPPPKTATVADLLHGGAQDVIELRSGQQVRGSIQEKTLTVHTIVGDVRIPTADVDGVVTSKDLDWDRSLLTRQGDLLQGRLDVSSLHVQQSDGSTSEVPAIEITRIGIHNPSATTEPANSELATTEPAEKPWVSTVGGDLIAIDPPTAVQIHTRYGTLDLDANQIAEINFRAPEHHDHEIVLIDGSRISGVLAMPSIDLKPHDPWGQTMTFPVSALTTIHLHAAISPQKGVPLIKLFGGDVLVGTLTGDIALETGLNAVTIHTPELASLSPLSGSQGTVSAVLSDGVSMRGRLTNGSVDCTTSAGVTMQVGLLLIAEYVQPKPTPTAAQVASVKRLVALLSSEDWNKRDHAESDLIAMGPVISDMLQQMQPDQALEGQQRIDTILAKFQDQAKP
jgi:hypothetical protein